MGTTAQPGPALSEGIAEVQGVFGDDASLQDAIARLTLAGFDRADLSLPHANPAPGNATPDLGSAPLGTPVDHQQMRTLGASTAAAVGAIGAAGITIATGGVALAAAGAALAAGAVAGGVTAALTVATDRAEADRHDEAGLEGLLVLSARTPNAVKQASAEAAMRAAGASRVEPVHRINAGLDR